MDWASLVNAILPQWLLAVAALIVAGLGIRAYMRCRYLVLSQFQMLWLAVTMLSVAFFYVLAILGLYAHLDHAIAVSRVNYLVLFLNLGLAFVGCKKEHD